MAAFLDVTEEYEIQNSHLHAHYHLILLGKSGVGKSACGNTILGKKAFESKKKPKTVTQQVQKDSVIFDGEIFQVYDTPGLFDLDKSNENLRQLESLLQPDKNSCTVVLLVMKADRLSPEDKTVVDLIEDFIPEFLIKNTWILFTRGDELEREDLTIDEFIEDTDELKRIVQRFENRYHIFSNFSQIPDQVRCLINKIKETAQIIYPEIIFPQIQLHPEEDPLHRKIVLVGKTGSGKSATGNTILGEKRFRSEFSLSSVKEKSKKEEAVVTGRNITVIDTPGIFDTTTKTEDLAKDIGRSIYLSAPGPHAFLYVLPIDVRFTKQEEDVIDQLENIFGVHMSKYTIILFTHGDALNGESINMDTNIQNNESLRKVVNQCGGRYHIFNNKDQRGKKQVTELLQKIDRMVEQNTTSIYTNKMFEEANVFKKEEEKNKNKKGFEAFYKKYKVQLFAVVGGGGTGLTVGAIVGGCVGGPVGAGVGVGVGAGVGAGISLLTGAGIQAARHYCKRSESRSTNTETLSDEHENATSGLDSLDPYDDSERTLLIKSPSTSNVRRRNRDPN